MSTLRVEVVSALLLRDRKILMGQKTMSGEVRVMPIPCGKCQIPVGPNTNLYQELCREIKEEVSLVPGQFIEHPNCECHIEPEVSGGFNNAPVRVTYVPLVLLYGEPRQPETQPEHEWIAFMTLEEVLNYRSFFFPGVVRALRILRQKDMIM